jgi:hypothetical protein
VSGVSGIVDLDEFNGTLQQLQAFAASATGSDGGAASDGGGPDAATADAGTLDAAAKPDATTGADAGTALDAGANLDAGTESDVATDADAVSQVGDASGSDGGAGEAIPTPANSAGCGCTVYRSEVPATTPGGLLLFLAFLARTLLRRHTPR